MTQEGTIQPLTQRQREVLHEIVKHVRAVGYPPSLRALGRRLGMNHSRVQQHLNALCKKGWLRSPTADGIHCQHLP